MKFFAFVFCFLLLMEFGCAPKKPVDRLTNEELKTLANDLAHKNIIADGHVDLPERLTDEGFKGDSLGLSRVINAPNVEFDFERAKKGGLSAPFMSIYISTDHQQRGDMGKSIADSLINMVQLITKSFPNKFALSNSPAEVETNFKAGKISLPMGMENGAPIGNDLSNVKYFYDRGIRYITLSHSKNNQICDSSGDTTDTWNGLSPFGEEVVYEMNRTGIMVDISHVSDSAFYDVMKIAKAPVIASHSSARYFAPSIKRDMTDDMIKKVGENDGVILINFYNLFLDSVVANAEAKNTKMLAELLKEKGLSENDSLAKPIIKQFKDEHPMKTTDVEMVANHFDHMVKLAGVDHVGFGSDFEGVNGELPTGLEDASTYPTLIYTLLRRGYTEEDIEKICYKNLWRVWNKVIEVSHELQSKS